MFRFLVTLVLAFILLQFAGCQLCNTPNDNRVAAFIDRCGDYRGFNPFFRAGSVFFNESGQQAMYGDIYANAGDFGRIESIAAGERADPGRVSPHSIDTPWQDWDIDRDIPPRGAPGIEMQPGQPGRVPTLQELLEQPRGTPTSTPPGQLLPPLPSGIPMPAPLPSGTLFPGDLFNRESETYSEPETLPFVPGDNITRPPREAESFNGPSGTFSPMPTPVIPPGVSEYDLPFTLEDLRRLDPSVRDVQIISIEDSAIGQPL